MVLRMVETIRHQKLVLENEERLELVVMGQSVWLHPIAGFVTKVK